MPRPHSSLLRVLQKKYRKVASEVIPKAEFLLRFGLGENLLESELENSGYSVNLTWALHLWIYISKRRNKYTVYTVINNISSNPGIVFASENSSSLVDSRLSINIHCGDEPSSPGLAVCIIDPSLILWPHQNERYLNGGRHDRWRICQRPWGRACCLRGPQQDDRLQEETAKS